MVAQLMLKMYLFNIDVLLYAGVVMVFFSLQDTPNWKPDTIHLNHLHNLHLLNGYINANGSKVGSGQIRII